MTHEEVLKKLPQTEPFLFVDELQMVSEEAVIGSYTFAEDSFFIKDILKDFLSLRG